MKSIIHASTNSKDYLHESRINMIKSVRIYIYRKTGDYFKIGDTNKCRGQYRPIEICRYDIRVSFQCLHDVICLF